MKLVPEFPFRPRNENVSGTYAAVNCRDFAFVRELRDICGRIAGLIDLFAEADSVLDATLHETLTREALGFAPAGQDADDGSD